MQVPLKLERGDLEEPIGCVFPHGHGGRAGEPSECLLPLCTDVSTKLETQMPLHPVGVLCHMRTKIAHLSGVEACTSPLIISFGTGRNVSRLCGGA